MVLPAQAAWVPKDNSNTCHTWVDDDHDCGFSDNRSVCSQRGSKGLKDYACSAGSGDFPILQLPAWLLSQRRARMVGRPEVVVLPARGTGLSSRPDSVWPSGHTEFSKHSGGDGSSSNDHTCNHHHRQADISGHGYNECNANIDVHNHSNNARTINLDRDDNVAPDDCRRSDNHRDPGWSKGSGHRDIAPI
mmetsp:Transcript_36020/g.99885  ORF Transcript_36020/g.99885 Transcript_36020/m.99885 type:complete len:191 (-) Transcript_36020:1026-1598(-)